MSTMFDALHWLRPHWLWALLAVPIIVFAWQRRRQRDVAWQGVVDAHLLPHLLEPGVARRGWLALAGGLLAYVLAVLALAGPSFGSTTQPLWQTRTPLVIVLDLSTATLATDVAPSRLALARAKIAQVLRARDGAQVGLVAFAGEPFTVAPLTDDAANVALFLDALHPDVIPIDGRRTGAALEHAAGLLSRAGFERGRLLLMSDGSDARDVAAAARLRTSGYTLDVLGLGSTRGAPVRSRGGIVTARLDAASLRTLAAAGGGTYAGVRTDDRDLRALGVLDATAMQGAAVRGQGTQRRDDGYWLLPPLLLLALLAFRRRAVAMVLAACVVLPMGRVHADDLWRRDDQQVHRRMVEGERAYRRGAFDAAAREFAMSKSADAHYNRGNALAKAGQYPDAIAAYDDALRARPGMEDAIANKRAVQAAMKRKPPPQGGKQSPSPQGGSGKTPGSKGASQPDPKQSPASPKQSDSNPGDATPRPDAQPPQAPPKPRNQTERDAQRAADAAQRARMREAEQRRTADATKASGATPGTKRETPAERERRIANEAWLRRVPDQPGALLKEKFRIEYERRQLEGTAR